MRTCFDPLEVADYRETVFALVRLGGEWAAVAGRPAPDPFTLYSACDYQQFFGGGRLARWSRQALHSLLLDWFPRHCAMPAERWPLVVPSLHSWLDFLDVHHLLDPAGDPLPTLHDALDGLVAEFPAAMADASRYGVEKVIITDLQERGLRPGDPRLFEVYLDDWRTGHAKTHIARLEQAAAVEAAHADEARRGPRPLPVWLPPDEELAAQARSVPFVQRLLQLVGWVGETGRNVTPYDDLTPAEAVELARFLNTGDPIPPDGLPKYLDDLPEVTLLVMWAKRAGFIRRYGGRLVQVKAARPTIRAPLLAYARVFRTLFDMQYSIILPKYPSTAFADSFPDAMQDALFALYGLPEPGLELDVLSESVWRACARKFGRDPADPRHARERQDVLVEFGQTIDMLVKIGVARRVPDGPSSRTCCVLLTPVGTFSVRNRLLAMGQPAPLVGELAAADARTLLYRLAEDYDTHSGRLEVACWLAAHGCAVSPQPGTTEDGVPESDVTGAPGAPGAGETDAGETEFGAPQVGMPQAEQDDLGSADATGLSGIPTMPDTPAELAARAELVDALRATPLRTRKALLLRILARSLPERHRFAESLLDSDDLGPTAVTALLESGHRTREGLRQHEAFWGVAESMAHVLEIGGPEVLAEQLARQEPQDSASILAAVARSGHPYAERILAAAARDRTRQPPESTEG